MHVSPWTRIKAGANIEPRKAVYMENFVVKAFVVLFKMVGMLLFCGLMASVLSDIQKLAFSSKRVGLVNMLEVNQQLVGKTKWRDH